MVKNLYPTSDIVVGLFLGDEGKGGTVDWLCSQQPTNAVVRFSGGPQAAHNVITPDGKHHTFAQLGAGSFHGVRTILSQYMMVNPFSLIVEADKFYETSGWDTLPQVLISENSLMVTPLHEAINKKREILRGADAHGSTGLGIGETRYYSNQAGYTAPLMKDLTDLPFLFYKLDLLAAWAEEEVGNIWELIPSLSEIKESYLHLADDDILNIVPDEKIYEELKKGYNVFEGSQGVLLDESFGFHPNTTWSTVTPKNAQTLLEESGLPKGRVIGVTRSYATRHGAGVFPSEFKEEGWQFKYKEPHNKRGEFQGAWRAGDLDLPLLEYATRAAGGVDVLSITHLDIPIDKVVGEYEGMQPIPTDFFKREREPQVAYVKHLAEVSANKKFIQVAGNDHLVSLIEEACKAPAFLLSEGPTWQHKTLIG